MLKQCGRCWNILPNAMSMNDADERSCCVVIENCCCLYCCCLCSILYIGKEVSKEPNNEVPSHLFSML